MTRVKISTAGVGGEKRIAINYKILNNGILYGSI